MRVQRYQSGITEREVSDAYARYGPLVLRRCRRILRDESAAEDALQEVFLRLWRYGSAFVEADSKVAWLYRVAERCCFDRIGWRAAHPEDPIEAASAEPRTAGPLAAIEDWDVVTRFLDRLDDRVRTVALLHYVDDLTQEQIAEATGWSRQTVAKKLTWLRARVERFKAELGREASRGAPVRPTGAEGNP
jgi:RNA polymerase sigma-70 factor (ECF subfamily)